MPYFTLHRNYTLRTTKGHTINFVKGMETWVPPMCVPDVVAIGAVAKDEAVDVLGEEEKPVVSISPEERKAKIHAAFDTMLSRSERTDFTASGLPHAKKLSDLVGFEVANRERDTEWQAYTQAKAEQE